MEKSYLWKQLTLIFVFAFQLSTFNSYAADGWPSQYKGVMLQAFYWDSYNATKWIVLEKQAKELGEYFDLVWLPQSANCGGLSMGYDDLYWFTNYNSSFGTESELRSLIKAFRDNGIGTIADVVINHRKNVSNWVDFPRETYNGVTYELNSTDIVRNDDGGQTLTWANQNGYSLSANNDTGEGWGGMRDLDHKSENVQKNVKAYLDLLLNDLGYVGFRYDMVKGYAGSYTKLYNESANPTYSVGECWDGTTTIRNWIDATSKTSAAFDFQFRYTVRNAANNGSWNRLAQQNDGNWPLVSNSYQNGTYRRYAVTFVENHDTERRSNAAQDPLKKDTLAANAYLLAMPGTPCIFLTHWLDCKQDLKGMIDVRKLVGIHNESTYVNKIPNTSVTSVAAYETKGDNGSLLVVLGKLKDYTPIESQWVKIVEGYHYAYYLQPSMNIAWVDRASGHYEKSFQTTLTAVSDNRSAQLVYTTDGTTPSANNGTRCASGTKVTIPANKTTTLKVGLLVGTTVNRIISRNYVVEEKVPFPSYDITVYVDPGAWGSNINVVNFWSWGGDGSHAPAKTSWPGDAISTKKTIDGKNWFYKTFRINAEDDAVSLVFSINNGSPQTVDVENVTHDAFFEVLSTTEGDKNQVKDVTSVHSFIPFIEQSDDPRINNAIYDLSGRKVGSIGTSASQLPKGIYIVGGKKFVIK